MYVTHIEVGVHSISRKFSISSKFSLCMVFIFRTARNVLIKFWNFHCEKYRNFTYFLGVEICVNAHLSHSFGRIAKFQKFPHKELRWKKLRYFSWCLVEVIIETLWHIQNLKLKFWNICAWTNCDYLLLHTINEFPDMIVSWKLHWRYALINKVGQWFYQLCNENFSKNIFWSVNYTLSFIKFIT